MSIVGKKLGQDMPATISKELAKANLRNDGGVPAPTAPRASNRLLSHATLCDAVAVPV